MKKGMFLGILNPGFTLGMLGAGFLISYVFICVPALFIILGASTYCWIFMRGSYTVFERNEKKLAGIEKGK